MQSDRPVGFEYIPTVHWHAPCKAKRAPCGRNEMTSTRSLALPTGQFMPAIGYGTWQASEEEITTALTEALEAGYRHIDTAPVYCNEAAIGKVLKNWLDSGKVKRSELFIVTKLPPTGNRPDCVEKWIRRSLRDLQLDYLDLYLVHTPFALDEVGDDLHPVDENGEVRLDLGTDHSKVWTAMERLVESGLTRAIGLSNFNLEQIKNVMHTATIPIANLQIEMHLYFQQKELVKFCQANGISLTAYSPLGSRGLVRALGRTETVPDLLTNQAVLDVAKKHGRTAAQVALKHIIQKGVAVIPKSTNAQRLRENVQLFDWTLDAEDVGRLDDLDLGSSARVCDFSFFKGIRRHPQFPFTSD